MTSALIIIPTYNEVENIERLVKEVRAQLSPFFEFEVLVVDDGSRDGTDKAVESVAALDPRVHLLERHSKHGLGTAYIAGFRYALEHDYPVAGTMDADFSHDPKYLPVFAEAIRDADLVIGSRYVPGGGVRNWGLHRRILSASANLLARLAVIPA